MAKRISRQAKLFQRRLEINRNRIEKRGVKTIFSALDAQNKWFISKAKSLTPKQLLRAVDKMPEEPIQKAFNRYYKSMATLPLLYHKDMEAQARRGSKASDEELINEYERFLTNFLKTDAAWKVVAVNDTTKARLVRDIQGALRKGELEGWGIERISEEILKNAKTNLGPRGINRARTIAQTEIISGSNEAATFAADQTGLKYQKYWSTSGLAKIRDSHQYAENWSVRMGGIGKNARFDMGDNTFMLHPGDAAGGPANVINCRCSVLFEVVV